MTGCWNGLSRYSSQSPPFLWGLWFLWRTYSYAQRRAEAVDVCKRVFVAAGANIVAEAMESARIDHAFEAAASTMAGIYAHRYVSPYDIAILFAHAGKQEEALAWVGTSVQERDPKLHFLNVDPEWQNVREDPRFQEYLKATGGALTDTAAATSRPAAEARHRENIPCCESNNAPCVVLTNSLHTRGCSALPPSLKPRLF